MRRNFTSIYLLILIFVLSCTENDNPVDKQDNKSDKKQEVSKQEAQTAFNYLNEIRQNPSAYADEIGSFMKVINPKEKLEWNYLLAEVARERALDMAKRNYFSHVDPDGIGSNLKIHNAGYELRPDWIDEIDEYSFESIAAGFSTGKAAIKDLIIDEGVPSKNHRNHLLGLNSFWGECDDIGIGFVYSEGSEFKSYCCILIAMHDFSNIVEIPTEIE